MVEIEVCVDSVESALEAERGGASRLEICSALAEGGLTPSHGMISEIVAVLKNCKAYALIRPRPGDFLYTHAELRVMKRDLLHAVEAGAKGIVMGFLTRSGEVDVEELRPFADMCFSLGERCGGGRTGGSALNDARSCSLALVSHPRCGCRRGLHLPPRL